MKKFTIGYINHDEDIFKQYLGKSINTLVGDFNVISKNSDKSPAENYNEMLAECETQYLILSHQDVIFQSDLLVKIESTIDLLPDFGVLGFVGANKNDLLYMANRYFYW